MENQGEIILYQPEDSVRLEVKLEDETVWLTQAQMAELFQTTKQNISLHVNNVYREGELVREATVKEYLTVQTEGYRSVKRQLEFYNLDVIISVGYRVKSKRGTKFRQWALQVLKDYILKGYAVNKRIEQLERTVAEHTEKIDFFVRTSLPPVEGIFYDGQLFDAYVFASDLVKSARKSIVLIDNYVDETVLMLLSKRLSKVKATIYTSQVSSQLKLDLQKYNLQYAPISIKCYRQSHDRFLVIDSDIYHLGASLKDLGRKWFAFSRLHLDAKELMEKLL